MYSVKNISKIFILTGKKGLLSEKNHKGEIKDNIHIITVGEE